MDVSPFRAHLDDYKDKYKCMKFRREDGILEVTFHTNGGPLRWGFDPHAEIEDAFLNIARDRQNKVVILTGTGDEYCGPTADPNATAKKHAATPEEWGEQGWESVNILMNMLAIDVPMISAVNGPAVRHPEIPIMCDIVLASEEAAFQDSAHFVGGLVPGDGVHVVFQLVMGYNRAKYFLMTGQIIKAQEAKEVGLVNEILPRENLLPRAWELARKIMKQPELNRRYARILLNEAMRRQMSELLPYGLALEGLALVRTK